MRNKPSHSGLTAKAISYCLFCLLLFGSAAAAEPPKTLSLDQAVAIALKNNPQVKQASNQVLLKKVEVKRNKLAFYPSLSLSATTRRQYNKTPNFLTGEYLNQDAQYAGLTLSVQRELFNGFYDKARLQQSKIQLDAAGQNHARSQEALIFETLQRYLRVLTAGEAVRAEQENLEAQQLQLERIEAFHKAGSRPIADLYQQKAEISRSQYRLLEAQRNVTLFKLQLFQTLGLEPNSHYSVTDPALKNRINTPNNLDSNQITADALARRKDLKALELETQAAQKAIKAARSGYFPRLSIFTELGTDYNSLNKTENFSSQFFDKNLNASVGLSLSIPLFDKGTTKSNTASAKIARRNRQLELEAAKNQVTVEVRQAVEDYRTAFKQVEAAGNQVQYAKSALAGIEARYHVQAATLVEVTQARSLFLEARYAQIEAGANLILKDVAVAFYKGDGAAIRAAVKQ